MRDIILSSFLSLFALFGKEEQVDETRAKTMLVSYLRHYFGIRNVDSYLHLYSDMRGVYEVSEELDPLDAVSSICENLHGKIQPREAAMLLLRVMEFCGDKDGSVPEPLFRDFIDYVSNNASEHVIMHRFEGLDGTLKTLHHPETGTIVFTYNGADTVLLNDVPVLPGSYQVLLQSSVLKGKNKVPRHYCPGTALCA